MNRQISKMYSFPGGGEDFHNIVYSGGLISKDVVFQEERKSEVFQEGGGQNFKEHNFSGGK